MLLRPAGRWALLLQNILGLYHRGHEVVDHLQPASGEGARSRKPLAGVGVVRHGAPLSPRPEVALQNALVWPIGIPWRPEHRVPAGRFDGRLHEAARRGVGWTQTHAPSTAQDLDPVSRIVTHKVKMMRRSEPFGDGGRLAVVQPGVQVARHVDVHLGVHHGEEAPDHGEHAADVEGRREAAHIAHVQGGVRAGQAAQVLVQVAPRLQVKVDADRPARVEPVQQGQVLLDSLRLK